MISTVVDHGNDAKNLTIVAYGNEAKNSVRIGHGNETRNSTIITHGNETMNSSIVENRNEAKNSIRVVHGNETRNSTIITHGNETMNSSIVANGNEAKNSTIVSHDHKYVKRIGFDAQASQFIFFLMANVFNSQHTRWLLTMFISAYILDIKNFIECTKNELMLVYKCYQENILINHMNI